MTAQRSDAERGTYAPIRCLLVLAVGLLLGLQCSAQTDQIYTLPTLRPPLPAYTGPLPVTESFILTSPLPIISSTVIPPAGVLILLPGGNGDIQLTPFAPSATVGSDGTLDINSSNFLVRSRWLFAAQHFVVITLDAATDFIATTGLKGQQGNPAHVADVVQVIQWARTTYPGLKVWLVGTSRGTAGAWVASMNAPPTGPDGLVFSSPVNVISDPDGLPNATLARITVPTLLVNNLKSACSVALPAADVTVATMLTGSPEVGNFNVDGGYPPLTSDTCGALSYHGYFGIEPITVLLISDWIKVF